MLDRERNAETPTQQPATDQLFPAALPQAIQTLISPQIQLAQQTKICGKESNTPLLYFSLRAHKSMHAESSYLHIIRTEISMYTRLMELFCAVFHGAYI